MTKTFDVGLLLAALVDVDLVVIGGVAAQAHGNRRTTFDLDVIPSPEAGNLACLADVLTRLDARPRDTPGGEAPSAEQLALAAIVPPLATTHGSLHILNDVPGAAPYPRLRARALTIEYEGSAFAVAGLDDLISMKRAAGRPRDLEDIAALIAANP